MSVQLQPLAAYYEACMRADWDYESADDPTAYRRGRDQVEALEAQARVSIQHRKFFEAFRDHEQARLSRAFGANVELPPLPAKPVEEAAE